ncbi:MAG: sel1 repeat family protein [Kordiimonadaceae bacterium]|nr:sel1 repeat family protein [Kordiimonadaceae bacterium]
MRVLFIISLFLLSSCGTMHTDCLTLSGDRDAYRMCTANQGNQSSQYELGVAAYDAEDYKTAIKWFRRAARPKTSGMPNYIEPTVTDRRDIRSILENDPPAPGHSGAIRLLVRIYSEGIGVPVDIKQAERYRKMINPI